MGMGVDGRLEASRTTLGQEPKNCVGRVMVNRQRLAVQLGRKWRADAGAFRAGSGWERLPVVVIGFA